MSGYTVKPITHDSIQAKLARKMSPGSGWCGRCGMPWRRSMPSSRLGVEPHVTNYGTHGRGCFPLCEDCWTLLGHPEARIEYYRDLVAAWKADGSEVDEKTEIQIARAVAAEPVTVR